MALLAREKRDSALGDARVELAIEFCQLALRLAAARGVRRADLGQVEHEERIADELSPMRDHRNCVAGRTRIEHDTMRDRQDEGGERDRASDLRFIAILPIGRPDRHPEQRHEEQARPRDPQETGLGVTRNRQEDRGQHDREQHEPRREGQSVPARPVAQHQRRSHSDRQQMRGRPPGSCAKPHIRFGSAAAQPAEHRNYVQQLADGKRREGNRQEQRPALVGSPADVPEQQRDQRSGQGDAGVEDCVERGILRPEMKHRCPAKCQGGKRDGEIRRKAERDRRACGCTGLDSHNPSPWRTAAPRPSESGATTAFASMQRSISPPTEGCKYRRAGCLRSCNNLQMQFLVQPRRP